MLTICHSSGVSVQSGKALGGDAPSDRTTTCTVFSSTDVAKHEVVADREHENYACNSCLG